MLMSWQADEPASASLASEVCRAVDATYVMDSRPLVTYRGQCPDRALPHSVRDAVVSTIIDTGLKPLASHGGTMGRVLGAECRHTVPAR
jgi:hypothetical protein